MAARLALAPLLLLLLGLAAAEVVDFEACPEEDGEAGPVPGGRSCAVHEVRISPCAEAAEHKPCKIKRGRSASISFDFTADVAMETATSRAFWANQLTDLPFLGMNTDACAFTTCPIAASQRQTYTYDLEISKKFPVRTYDVKWKLWNETDNAQCCFIAKIKLVK